MWVDTGHSHSLLPVKQMRKMSMGVRIECVMTALMIQTFLLKNWMMTAAADLVPEISSASASSAGTCSPGSLSCAWTAVVPLPP